MAATAVDVDAATRRPTRRGGIILTEYIVRLTFGPGDWSLLSGTVHPTLGDAVAEIEAYHCRVNPQAAAELSWRRVRPGANGAGPLYSLKVAVVKEPEAAPPRRSGGRDASHSYEL